MLAQSSSGVELEYILVDGESSDGSQKIIDKYRSQIDRVVIEPDEGPFDAINKGLKMATGDLLGWLNSDDIYMPDALKRVDQAMTDYPEKALCFGHCPIVDEEGREIRKGITRFKEMFFPFSSRFVIECINYISQPAFFFRRSAYERAGALRMDFKAAWDYDLILRLWREGGGVQIPGDPIAAFRWHAGSISGRHFKQQFKEEAEAAAVSAGRFSLQNLIHTGVRWGIVGIYSLMARQRSHASADRQAGGKT